MIQTQYAYLPGKEVRFKATDPIIGNTSHLSQSMLLVVVEGQLEITLQQMMVKNGLGHMEPLSAEVQMSDSGQVEMVYPSERISQIFEAGQLIEIRPGCAYAINPISNGLFIEYVLPLPYETPLFGSDTGLIGKPALEDLISFELVKEKPVTAVNVTEPILEVIIPEVAVPEVIVPDTELPVEQSVVDAPKKFDIPDFQRYYYRDASTAMLRIGLYCFIPFVEFALTVNDFNFFWALALLATLAFCGYKAYLEADQHFRNLPVLSIESDGILISNRTYINLKLNWDQILQVRIDLKHAKLDYAELMLVIEVGDMSACMPSLNILQKMWFRQLQVNDPSISPPKVTLSQADVGTDLNDLKALLDRFV